MSATRRMQKKYLNRVLRKGLAAKAAGQTNWTKRQLRSYAQMRINGIGRRARMEASLKALKNMSINDAMKFTTKMLGKWEKGVDRLVQRDPQFRDAVAKMKKCAAADCEIKVSSNSTFCMLHEPVLVGP